MEVTVHNPDRYMGDLRQILAQGRKRIGLLLGAGGPASILIGSDTSPQSQPGSPLIPTVDRITEIVIEGLDAKDVPVIQKISSDLKNPNIEAILSHVRSLAKLIGCSTLHGCDGTSYRQLAKQICDAIGNIVGIHLPSGNNPYTEIAAWIGGTDRKHPIEVFTPNYDLLLEEAFERLEIPFFDGFSGSFEPFFDPPSIASNDLPTRWVRLWKVHGSIGWGVNKDGAIIRGQGRTASELIYPDHLKYDQIQKLPYTALFDRLRRFLTTPDTLLITCGFSYRDAHISAVIDESLSANPSGAVFAFQYQNLSDEGPACALARKRPNISVFARNGAVINCLPADWKPGELPSKDWDVIRSSFWGVREPNGNNVFLLGDFVSFARFLSLIHAERIEYSVDGIKSESET
jgi:hypothetical protein